MGLWPWPWDPHTCIEAYFPTFSPPLRPLDHTLSTANQPTLPQLLYSALALHTLSLTPPDYTLHLVGTQTSLTTPAALRLRAWTILSGFTLDIY